MNSGTAQDGGSATNLKTLLQLLQTPEAEAEDEEGRPYNMRTPSAPIPTRPRFSSPSRSNKDGPVYANSAPQFCHTGEKTHATQSGDRSGTPQHVQHRDRTHHPRLQGNTGAPSFPPQMLQPAPQNHQNAFRPSPQQLQPRCNSEPAATLHSFPMSTVSQHPLHLTNHPVPQSGAAQVLPTNKQHQNLARQTHSADPSVPADASIPNLKLVQQSPYIMPPTPAQQYTQPTRCRSVTSPSPNLSHVPELKGSGSQQSLSSPVAFIVHSRPPQAAEGHRPMDPANAPQVQLLNGGYSNMMHSHLLHDPLLKMPTTSDKTPGAVTMQSKHATDVYTSVGPVIHNRNDAEVDSATFSSSSIPMMICNSFVKHEGANNPQIHPRPIMMPVCHAYASPEPTHPTSMDTQLAEVPSTASRLPASSMEEGLLNISYGHGQNPQYCMHTAGHNDATAPYHPNPGNLKRPRDAAGKFCAQNHGSQSHMGMHEILPDPSLQDIPEHYRRPGSDQESFRGRSTPLGMTMPLPPASAGKTLPVGIPDAAMHEADAYTGALQKHIQISQPVNSQPATDSMLGDLSSDPTKDQIAEIAHGAQRALSSMGLMKDMPHGFSGSTSMQTSSKILDPVSSHIPAPRPVSFVTPKSIPSVASLEGQHVPFTGPQEAYNTGVKSAAKTTGIPVSAVAQAPQARPCQGPVPSSAHSEVPVKSFQDILVILRSSATFRRHARMVLIPAEELENESNVSESYVSHVYRAQEMNGYLYTIQAKK